MPMHGYNVKRCPQARIDIGGMSSVLSSAGKLCCFQLLLSVIPCLSQKLVHVLEHKSMKEVI
jgi:hypothetical protein